jgi:fructose-specific phosphotransferase system IIA component
LYDSKNAWVVATTVDISLLINQDAITLELEAKDKSSAIDELAGLLEKSGKLRSKSEYVEAVHARESMVSTAVGFGIAIPHARSSSVINASVAFGKSTGFQWDDTENEPIRLVFLLAVPEKNTSTEYMAMLASLARMLVHEDFRQSLLKATTKEEVLKEIYSVSKAQVSGKT